MYDAPMARKESRMLGGLLQKLAPRIGARVVLEPEWRIAGRIEFADGRRSYFRYNTLDLNPVGASDIAKDKDYAAFFMRASGYPVPRGKTFFSASWAKAIRSKRGIDAAWRYARTLGLPVVVKPNSGSQGAGVALVGTKRDFYAAMRSIFKRDRVALVQEPVAGRDYRVVVLDGEVISAYERIPLTVTGDGHSSIRRLLREKAAQFARDGRDTQLDLADPRIGLRLRRQKRTLASVPERGETVRLLDNANLSTGGDAIDVTARIHPGFAAIAAGLTAEMGLRLAGVDLMVDGSITEAPKRYCVLEINAAPGLDHYVTHGARQRRIVEDLYLRVLESLAKQPHHARRRSSQR